MSRTIGAYEAKTHLPRLLKEVAAGESIAITKHGVVVALLVPPSRERFPNVDEVIDEMRRFEETEQISLSGVSIRELIEEGRM